MTPRTLFLDLIAALEPDNYRGLRIIARAEAYLRHGYLQLPGHSTKEFDPYVNERHVA